MSWIFFILFEILRNWFIICIEKKRPSYKWSYMIRWAGGAVFLLVHNPSFDPLGDVTTIFPAVNYMLFQATSFYLLFDLALNILRGKRWDYQGANSGLYFDKLTKPEYYCLKAGCVVILVLSLIILTHAK